ncbi:TadE/TadG family type IV pilus assembly protein [uncultured Jatrophihabitans sp.]|uniref:TadE/TadG family type IV pilus assembly protein n=1 Tax=uncultured Jatrophihabitans sp. TaxID=1610747 RepID=UPI0035C9E48C
MKRRFQQLRQAGDGRADGGSAIIEFVFVAIVIMVPLMYLVAAVATVQRAQLAVSQAARDAGRAFATSDTAAQAGARVEAAVRLALTDQGLPNDATVRFVPSGSGCAGPGITPVLRAGAEFAVCVSRRTELPGVPTVLSGRGIRTVAEFVVYVDDFRNFSS